MKILAIGDFHGHIPAKLKSRVKKYIKYVDLVLSPGDYAGNDEYSKIFFKKVYGTKNTMEDVVGKKKYNKMMKDTYNSGIKSVRWLNGFNKPVLGITGNWDFSRFTEIGYGYSWQDLKKEGDKKFIDYMKMFYKEIKKFKNFRLIDMSKIKLKDFTIIGHTMSSYPGDYHAINKKKFIAKYGYKAFMSKRYKIKRDYNGFKSRLDKLFRNEKDAIFLGHNSPYGVLDIVGKKGHKWAKGEHYGSWLARQTILKHKPRLYICGHMHEHQGLVKLGKTLVVNTGSGHEGKFAIIDYGKKIKIKFVK